MYVDLFQVTIWYPKLLESTIESLGDLFAHYDSVNLDWRAVDEKRIDHEHEDISRALEQNDKIKLQKHIPGILTQCMCRYGWYGFPIKDKSDSWKIACKHIDA